MANGRQRPTSVDLLEVGVDELGEGPWWDAETQSLWWVDVLAHRIQNADLNGAVRYRVETPDLVSFAIPHVGGGLVAGLAGRISHLLPTEPRRWETLWAADFDTARSRINDGKTDRSGNLWFGSMDRAASAPTGLLYGCLSGMPSPQPDPVTVSNGIGWSPDGDRMYFTDSAARTIWTFRYDPGSGVGQREVFAADDGSGTPDGLTVDTDGCVWSARWNGSKLTRYRPDGTVDREIRLPVRKPTSVAFVGSDLKTLAVTSAALEVGDGDLAGAVLLIGSGAQGLPEARAATPS